MLVTIDDIPPSFALTPGGNERAIADEAQLAALGVRVVGFAAAQAASVTLTAPGVSVANPNLGWNFYPSVVQSAPADVFNPAWATSGFRVLRLLRPGRKGELVRVWTTDVGGSLQQSPWRATITFADGSRRVTAGGFSRTVTPPAWPAGTVSLVDGEMDKVGTDPGTGRPWAAPGSPPIWVPNGEFVL
jgi:hypothetical protein